MQKVIFTTIKLADKDLKGSDRKSIISAPDHINIDYLEKGWKINDIKLIDSTDSKQFTACFVLEK